MAEWSNSKLAILSTCNKKYELRYERGLVQKETPWSMRRGTWVHAGLAANRIKRGLAAGSLLHVPEHLDLRIEGFKPIQVTDVLTAELPDRNVKSYPMDHHGVCAMMRDIAQQRNLGEPDTKDADEVEWLIDRHWEVSQANTEHDLLVEYEWHRPYSGESFTGTVDHVYVDDGGEVVVRDTKTHFALPDTDSEDLATQLQFYAWGLTPWLAARGHVPMWIEWDYLTTSRSKPPQFVKDGSRPYATALEADGTPKNDHMTFIRGVKEAGLDPANFKEMIEAARHVTGQMFTCQRDEVSSAFVENFLQSSLAHIDRWNPDDVPYSFSYGCRSCSFKKICALEAAGKDASHVIEERFTSV